MEDFYFEEPEYPFLNRLKKALNYFGNASMALLVTFILLRGAELVFIFQANTMPADLGKILWVGLTYDLLFFIKTLPLIFFLFAIVFLVAKFRVTYFIAYGVLASIFILLQLILIKYFSTAMVPLGADIFGYSLAEIRQTVGASAKLDFQSVILVLAPLLFFWGMYFIVSRKRWIKPSVTAVILIVGGVLSYNGVSAIPEMRHFKTDFSYNLSLNKGAFFTEKTYAHFVEDEPEVDIYAINYIEDDTGSSKAGFKPFQYLTNDYPFLRLDETEDVLGNFFELKDSIAPNFVFIQVEGLGRAYSGSNAYLGSFTPFLDALASKSLYFENFLAAQGRTFASLPSILGSLPFADKGFSDLGTRMPLHFSLPRILKQNGYQTKFYSGFDNSFDNQDIFLKKQGMDVLIGEEHYEASFKKSPANAGGFTWGYADLELMTKAIQLEKKYTARPSMLFLQTISMHTPYTIPNQQVYEQLFEKHLAKLGFDETAKEDYRKYKNIYSTVLYTDEALKYFFLEYAKLPGFKNTVFVITGDHRLPEIPMSTKIDRYHVPLIIYSPLLKRTASFRSISTHFDITPSIVAFLKKNYKLKAPPQVAWIGAGLDTARSFRNVHQVPLKQTKSDLHNFISGLYFMDQDVVFSISDNMNIRPLDDDSKLNELRSQLNQFKAKNNRIARELKLIPDSVFAKFN